MLERTRRDIPFTYSNMDTGEALKVIRAKDMLDGVNTKVMVELYDDLTGKKKEEWKGENILTDAWVDYHRYLVKNSFLPFSAQAGRSANIWANVSPASAVYNDTNQNLWMDYLLLSKDSSAELAATKSSTEKLTGYSQRAAAVTPDTVQGTINGLESFVTNDNYHFVFDFPTSCANGTFNSVLWGSNPTSFGGILVPSLTAVPNKQYFYTGLSNVQVNGNQYFQSITYDPVGGNFYVVQTGTIQQCWIIRESDMTIINNFTFTGVPTNINQCIYVSGFLYIVQYTNSSVPGNVGSVIYKVNASTGGAATSINMNAKLPSTANIYICGIRWDGTNFWILSTNGNSTTVAQMCKFDSTLTTLISNSAFGTTYGTFDIKGDGTTAYVGLHYNGTYLMSAATNRSVLIFYDPVTYQPVKHTFSITPNYYMVNPVNGNESFWFIGYNGAADKLVLRKYVHTGIYAKTLLASPVTKTSANTMKIIYDFSIS